jgi:FkbM family methyltransferase
MSKSLLKWKLAQMGFYLNRFSALPRAQRLFRDVEQGTKLERRLFGHRFVVDVSRDGLLYLVGERCVAEADLVRSLLAPGMRTADVGANIGCYTLMLSQIIGPTGHIIAIEPSQETLPQLKLNIELNQLRNVEIVAKAVGNERKVVGLRSGTNSGVVVDETRAPYHVQQDLIDHIITAPIDFLKIDVEGYEGFAIDGAQRVLSEYRPTVFLEMHPFQLKQYHSDIRRTVENLSRFYPDITMHEQKEASGISQKACFYYGGMSSIEKITDPNGYVNRCLAGEITRPFWLVCRAPRFPE